MEVECPQCGARLVVEDCPNLAVAYCRTCDTTWVAKIVRTVRVESLTDINHYYKERRDAAGSRCGHQ